jgi:MFS family permease
MNRVVALTQKQLSKSMSLNIAAGAMGSMWFVVCSNQPIYNAFLKNALGISSSRLGLILSVTQFMAAFQLVSILIFGTLRRRKPFVIAAHVVQRVYAFVLMGVALWARALPPGRAPSDAFPLVFAAMTLAWIAWNACSAGWWAWVADIFPDAIRGSFFGKRSAIINVVNIAWFFGVTLALDWVPESQVFLAYAAVFGIAGTVGVVDMALHLFIPEPLSETRPRITAADFFAPLRDRNYLGFVLAAGMALFSINIFAPFTGPYVTGPDGLGAPNTWLGISYALSQLAWVVAAPLMGVMMDRFGRKPVVVLGLLSVLNWFGYLFISRRNYVFLLPTMSLFSGFLASGFWEGQNQMMLGLTPGKNRTAYVSWYLALTGMIASAGPYAGGLLHDALGDFAFTAIPGVRIGAFQVVMLISLALCFLSAFALSRVHEGKTRPLGQLLSRLANPEFFRTVLNLGIISGSAETDRTLRALRLMDGPVSDIALVEVLGRSGDTDIDVRIEAVRALARIRAKDTVPTLIALLDEESLVRSEAALALGKLADSRALGRLVEGLSSPSIEFQDACARSIGLICEACAERAGEGADAPEARLLLDLLLSGGTGALGASAAEAMSRVGDVDSAVDIYPRYRAAPDGRVRRQFAVALANLMGESGEFYRYVTGNDAGTDARLSRLSQEALRNARALASSVEMGAEDNARLEEALARIAEASSGNVRSGLIPAIAEAGLILAHACPPGTASGSEGGRRGTALMRWFMEELGRMPRGADDDPALIGLDALLGLYAISRFRP